MDLWLLDVRYIGPKWSGPSWDPAQVGARCTGLPFLNLVEDFDKNWVDENLVQFRLETFCGVLYNMYEMSRKAVMYHSHVSVTLEMNCVC
jgi:hypothetical protein